MISTPKKNAAPRLFTKHNMLHGIIYVLGALFIALSVVLIIKSDLGTTPWDTLHYAIYRISPLTLGMSTALVAIAITIFVIWYRKSWRYLLMAIPILIVSVFIDLLFEVILKDFDPAGNIRMFAFVGGSLLLPLGGTLLIISKYPAGVFDELMLAIMKIFKTRKILIIRFFLELSPVVIALLLTGLFNGTTGSLNFGTAYLVIITGPMMQFYMNIIRRIKNED
jgi:uncharacterized membrane protein YczE